ncbi:MAG: ammonium transporter [Bifidobacteriaceae bacterium]|nr:ammonium transporter [Bifidobacteriaceae bacterium]
MGFVLDAGNTAWILTSATLVLMMTVPALAFFYGGLVRTKSVLNMMMLSFGVAGVIGVVWVLWGYSMSFGSDVAGLFGNPFELFGLTGLTIDGPSNALAGSGVPAWVWVGFQATFAVITVALISGALADRVRFGPWLVFVGVWGTLVYFPMCHMVWGGGMLGADGWVARLFATPLDFAGGTVVHINAGMAGLVLALVIGRRQGFGKVPMRPHNVPFVMLGAALLWIGWFGFNAGSAGAANDQAGLAWVNTFVATAAAAMAWAAAERVKDGKPTSVGVASGVVAGLVAITPAAGFVSPLGSIAIGAVAGVLCALAVGLKYRLGYDDSLDVVGVHLVGGLVGTVMLGLVATESNLWDGARAGLFYGGGLAQLGAQTAAALFAVAYSGALTAVIGLAIKGTMGWRIADADEVSSIDLAEHGETAYESITSGRLAMAGAGPVISGPMPSAPLPASPAPSAAAAGAAGSSVEEPMPPGGEAMMAGPHSTPEMKG